MDKRVSSIDVPITKFQVGSSVWVVDRVDVSKHIIEEIRYATRITTNTKKTEYFYSLSGRSDTLLPASAEEKMFSNEEDLTEHLLFKIKSTIKDETQR